ncbi:MAG TPA: Ig-like domain-containing protein [Thermoleophilaceae bacterium]
MRRIVRARRPWKLLAAAIAAFALIPVASASAGRMLVTGHDADFHCTGGAQCHFVQVATSWVRAGAPDPTKPVLVLDASDLDFPTSLDNAFGAGGIPTVVMDPKSPQFAAEPLTTDRYSAILVASDETCGGCDLNTDTSTPDSDAINARKADIEAFFNAGGGVYANAGADHADGDPTDGPDVYYNFLPIPATGVAVTQPFCLTDAGIALGFEDATTECSDPSKQNIGTHDDINCCPTHNSFAEPPAGGALQVSERDSKGFAETLFGEGKIGNGVLDNVPPASAATVPACSADGKLTVTVTDNAGGSGPKAAHFTVDGGAEQVAPVDAAGHAVITLLNGKHTVTFWGEDAATNQETAHHTVTATVDTVNHCAPKVGVAGVRRACVTRSFTLKFSVATASTVKRVTVKLDGKKVTSKAKSKFRLKINSRKLKAGRHRLTITAVDAAGGVTTIHRTFSVCKAVKPKPRRHAAPRFTG